MIPARQLIVAVLAVVYCATQAIVVEKGRGYDFQQYLRARDCSAWGLGKTPVPAAFQ